MELRGLSEGSVFGGVYGDGEQDLAVFVVGSPNAGSKRLTVKTIYGGCYGGA